MVIKKSSRRMVDLRKAPSDIVNSAKKNAVLGAAIERLSKSGKKLTQFLKTNILRR